MSKPKPRAITRLEQEDLIVRLAESRGHAGFTVAEGTALVRWAERVRKDETTLSLILAGVVNVDVVGGEIAVSKREGLDVAKVGG
jgi:hypothetical protein